MFKAKVDPLDPYADAERIAWARSLSDQDVRALASDFLRGYTDQCNEDAYREYERRFGAPHAVKQARSKSARKKRRA